MALQIGKEMKQTMMEKIREYLQLDIDDSEAPRVEELLRGKSFYEDFSLRGIRVNRVDPGFISCTFKVPLRLTVCFPQPLFAQISFNWIKGISIVFKDLCIFLPKKKIFVSLCDV